MTTNKPLTADPKDRIATSARRISDAGGEERGTDTVVAETPVAMVYNGISCAVMMATPDHLEEFALGFSLSEGYIDTPTELYAIDVVPQSEGIAITMTVASRCEHALKLRKRSQTGRTGCGLCGVEALDQAIRPIPKVRHLSLDNAAIRRAVANLAQHQSLQRDTGGSHAAAWCTSRGEIALAREDVGRHNALDKLLGARAQRGIDGDGFVLMSSRASYELVHKTASAGVSALVALSAPTSLAIEQARQAGLTLIAFAREGRHTIYTP